MKAMILNAGLLSVGFMALFALAGSLHALIKLRVEYTRKLVHFGTGLLTMLFPVMLESTVLVLLLCSSFLAVLYASQKWGLLQSINGVERKTHGALLFPVVVANCFLLQSYKGNPLYFYLPILILTVSDPIAALVGKRFSYGKYTLLGHTKTVVGSLGFFLSAFLVAGFGLYFVGLGTTDFILKSSAAIAILATVAEAISKDGFDNLSIPFAISLGLYSINFPDLC